MAGDRRSPATRLPVEGLAPLDHDLSRMTAGQGREPCPAVSLYLTRGAGVLYNDSAVPTVPAPILQTRRRLPGTSAQRDDGLGLIPSSPACVFVSRALYCIRRIWS